jgi:two-component system KDP operon response regulator KdpE
MQIRRLLHMNLETNGYRVYEAATGNDGLTLAAALKPDIVLSDVGLPDIDGMDTLQRLREWSQSCGISRKPIQRILNC